MAKKRGIGQIVTDLEKQINSDYNALIQLTVEGLGTEQNSPVDTGFFASSWKASTQKVRAQDKREDYSPWSKIYKTRTPAGDQRVHTSKKPIGSQIKPRLRSQSSTTNASPRSISATQRSMRAMPWSLRRSLTLFKVKCVPWFNRLLGTNVLAAFLPELDPAAVCLGLIPSSKL